jgi:Yip1-like protein
MVNPVTDTEARTALIDRVKNILVQPKVEWPKIASEPATIGSLYSNYVVYLAAVPVLATFIGSLIFGYSFGNITVRPSFFGAVFTGIVQFLLALAVVYVLALIIDMLAPRFGGVSDRINAFKLAAYSLTASWVAGIFGLVPALGFLSILGLYSFYLLYVGAPVLMGIPPERSLAYTAVIIVIGIVISLIVGALTVALVPTPQITPTEVGGKVTLPGGVSLDMEKLEKATKNMEAMAKRMEQSQGAGSTGKPSEDGLSAISADSLKALLPTSLPGGFARGEVSSSSASAAGFNFGTAKAVYNKGDERITLSLIDMGAMGAFAALGSAFGANASEETDTSYSKIGSVDGRMAIEEFNRETEVGKFAVIVSERVMVEAEGAGASIDDLKSAVGEVDFDNVEALASAG